MIHVSLSNPNDINEKGNMKTYLDIKLEYEERRFVTSKLQVILIVPRQQHRK